MEDFLWMSSAFGARAQPLDADRGPQWHPLVFHSLDVAAIGAALLACAFPARAGMIRCDPSRPKMAVPERLPMSLRHSYTTLRYTN